MTADDSIRMIIRHEGGYVDDPDDPGGRTKYGISQRAYPDLDIAALTVDDAAEIYRRDYWDRVRGDDLPPAVAHVVFDAAVNMGVGVAIRLMQRQLGVAADGIIGPVTLAAARDCDVRGFCRDYQVRRIRRYSSLPGWHKFGAGWSIRALRVLAEALEMAGVC